MTGVQTCALPISKYKVEICYRDGYCETRDYSIGKGYLANYYTDDFIEKELIVSFGNQNDRPDQTLYFVYFPNRQSNQLLIEVFEKVNNQITWDTTTGYLDKCTLSSNTTNTNTQKTYTTNPKSLASSYKYETCARISNKRECSTGNIKLQRLKDGEYEFEEEASSSEVFYGAIKVKGSEIELQMVDFIEGEIGRAHV